MAVDGAIEVADLQTHFVYPDRVVRAVDGVSFRVERGRTLAIVGESGSGKSMTALSIVRLLPPRAQTVGGSIRFDGRDLLSLREQSMRDVRGNRIAIMFQDPMTALNPSLRVGFQIMEAVLEHGQASESEARRRALELVQRMGLPHPKAILDSYPHELSGGMRQRAILAMALSCGPDVLIADEPTTALDVTTQEQIVDLLQELQAAEQLALILITHDLGVVARIADEVLVMYAGRPVEYGDVYSLFANPAHPYTRGLLASVEFERYAPRERLQSIPGVPARLDAVPPGCPFHPRCPYAADRCTEVRPELGSAPGFTTATACIVAQAGDLEPAPPSSGGGGE